MFSFKFKFFLNSGRKAVRNIEKRITQNNTLGQGPWRAFLIPFLLVSRVITDDIKMFADIESFDDHGHRDELNETNFRFIMAKVDII